MKWSLENGITVGYGFALALVVGVGSLSYWTTSGFIDSSHAVTQRYGTIESLDAALSAQKDANANAQDYVLMGAVDCLKEYTNAAQTVRHGVRQLELSLGGDLKAAGNLHTFETNAARNFALLAQGVAMPAKHSPGSPAFETWVKANRLLLETNRAIVAEMRKDQGEMMRLQAEESQAVAQKTKSIVLAASFLTLLIVSWAILIINRDLSERKKAEEEREKLIAELQEALTNIKTLGGLLPICAWCKKIRDDKGYWNQVEAYIQQRSEATFSHALCPECARKMNEELQDLKAQQGE
jgi:CHASE3 domain sensor protein